MVELVLTVMVEEPDEFTDWGLKLTLTPIGRTPLTLNMIFLVNPPEGVTVIV